MTTTNQMIVEEPTGSSSLSVSSVAGTPKVYQSIANVMLELSAIGIGKNNKNQQQGYKFRGIDDVYNALARLLGKHGLVILPRVLKHERLEGVTSKGGTIFYTLMDIEFTFVSAEDGSSHKCVVVGEAMDSADKSSNKAMSAAYKYACLQAFCIPTEGDNDADATTHDVAQLGSRRPAPPQSKPAPAASATPAAKAPASITPELKANAEKLAKECAEISVDGIPAYSAKLKELAKLAGGMAITKQGYINLFGTLSSAIEAADADTATQYGKLAEHFPKNMAATINNLVTEKVTNDVFATKE